MLNIVNRYAFTWQYSFSTTKSKILVFGESAASQKRPRPLRSWSLGGFHLSEADSVRHLGITLSVNGSSLDHTLQSISRARSSFYALQEIGASKSGARFGCLHPLTSLKLYKAIALSLLQFGIAYTPLKQSCVY